MNQKLLIIDDSPPLHAIVRSRLAAEAVEIHAAPDAACGLGLCENHKFDVILLDIDLPNSQALDLCRKLKANPSTSAIPIIFLTGTASSERKLAALELGAIDFITKPFDPIELRARVRAALRTKHLLDLLSDKAMIDGLSGLWNRAYFDQRLAAELNHAKRNGSTFAVVLLDVDHLKDLNERFGHAFGDEVLRHVGRVLHQQCRAEDFVFRFDGDCFAILTPGVGAYGAGCLSQRLRTKVAEKPLIRGNQSFTITASFGIADCHDSGASPLPAAESAVKQAKASGGNCIILPQANDISAMRKSA